MDNTFQIIFIGVFIVTALVGVAIFATGSLSGGGDDQLNVSFTIWGEWESDTFDKVLETSGLSDRNGITINYESIASNQLENRLINALARDNGPDVLLMPHTQIINFSDLITVIGTDFYSLRQFRDTFIDGGEIFSTSEGILALPVAVDPLVMYWNRDIFANANILTPPRNWDDVSDSVKRITVLGNNQRIHTAGISLGTYRNVSFYKEIISTLLLQTGNNIVGKNSEDRYTSLLGNSFGSTESAVGMYTQYANPSSDFYSWNNTFESDFSAFTSGNLGLYLAPASSISRIRSQNPNLNFDVSLVPRLEGGVNQSYGEIYGFAIMNQAQNKQIILEALKLLTDYSMAESIISETNMSPVRRDILSESVRDPYKQVFINAAFSSRGWLDPNPDKTAEIFANIINNVNSGQLTTLQAIKNADNALESIMQSVNN